MIGAEKTHHAAQRFVGGLSRREFLAIACLFWVYVTVSNLLYGYSMRAGIARVSTVMLFAAWDARLLQHLFLLPLLLVSYWASLRVQWRPLLLTLPLQLILGVVFSAAAYPALILAQVMFGREDLHEMAGMAHLHSWVDPFFLSLWLASFVNFLPAYGFGLALVTGLALYIRFRDSEMRLVALERQWSAARLAALRMQLSPHTLFNLLHTIRGHIEWDPKGAQSMVVQLADLLRRLLNAGERDFSRLTDELHFARLYLELQQRRFAERLSVTLPIESNIPAVWVPSLILQPLIENAVLHGMAGHQGAVTVSVTVNATNETLSVRLCNTMAANRIAGADGIGLKNVRERLAVQFEGQATLSAGESDGQWCSEITMPAIYESPPLVREPTVGEKRGASTLVRT
jgi:Histidine kinase